MSNVSLKVKIFDAKGTQILQVSKSALTIGTSSHCDVVLDHPSVHSEHARAWLEGGRVWVQDLGGEQGTSLNEIRLPALKPMLVRELDVLRLGRCEATLGIEPNMMRAPVVKARPLAAPEEPTKNVLKDAEALQRKAELETLARELASLRLQLQMARLEKSSNQELANQLENLKVEIKSNQDQKQKWTETLQQMEVERQQQRKSREMELKDLKTRLEKEACEERERAAHLLETAKRDYVGEMARQMRAVSSVLVKRWATRPLSQDMIFEWEGELIAIFRKVLLGDGAKMTLLPELPPLIEKPSRPVPASEEVTVIRSVPLPKEKIALKIPRQKVAIGSAGVFVFLGVLWLGSRYSQNKPNEVGQRTSASAATRVPAARYEPKQAKKYRATYTDNVLYLENYVAAEQNQDFRKRWTTELNRVLVSEWKMDAAKVAPIIAKEQALIRDLEHLKSIVNPQNEQAGLAQMRSREALFQRELEGIFKTPTFVNHFLKFKRAYYVRNQAYLTKESP